MKKIGTLTSAKTVGWTFGFLAVMVILGCSSGHQSSSSTKSMSAERTEMIAKNQVNAVAQQQLAQQPTIPPLSVNTQIKSAS